MSSSVLMATQVTSWSCPERTCTGRGERPLEKPPWGSKKRRRIQMWSHNNAHVSDLESDTWGRLPAVGPATRYRMCPLNQRWGRCHRDPEPSKWQHLCGQRKIWWNTWTHRAGMLKAKHATVGAHQCAGRSCPPAFPCPVGWHGGCSPSVLRWTAGARRWTPPAPERWCPPRERKARSRSAAFCITKQGRKTSKPVRDKRQERAVAYIQRRFIIATLSCHGICKSQPVWKTRRSSAAHPDLLSVYVIHVQDRYKIRSIKADFN